MAIDPNETREWAKGCEKVCFDNITIEEMLEEFCNHSKELASTCARYISSWSQRGYQLTKQKQEYEKEIKEWEEECHELEKELEAEELKVECHLDALEVAKRWRLKQIKSKDDELEKASERIKLLESFVAWQKYVTDKQYQELPALPKKQNKFKKLVNKVREVTKEKFNTYILHKDK